jgi:hypothetical protein
MSSLHSHVPLSYQMVKRDAKSHALVFIHFAINYVKSGIILNTSSLFVSVSVLVIITISISIIVQTKNTVEQINICNRR